MSTHLERLRELEIVAVRDWVAGRFDTVSWHRGLELGCGMGFQAAVLRTIVPKIHSVDVVYALDADRRLSYESFSFARGDRLPFADASFDFVFSSNVLEHVPDFEATIREVCRVLTRGGLAAHVVPNERWKKLSILGFVPLTPFAMVRNLCRRAMAALGAPVSPGPRPLLEQLLPAKHGEFPGSSWSELTTFSTKAWEERFAAALQRTGARGYRVRDVGLPLYSPWGYLRILPTRWRIRAGARGATDFFVHGARGCAADRP